jgi:hypothetical protein
LGKKNRNLVDSFHHTLPNRQWIYGWHLLGGSAKPATKPPRRRPVGSGVRCHVRLIDSDTCQEGAVAKSPGAGWPAVVADHIGGRSPSPRELPGFEDPNRRSRASCLPTGVAHRDSRPRDSDRTNGSLRSTDSLAITLLRTTTCVLHHPLFREVASEIPEFFFPTLGVWRSLNLLAGYRPYRTLFGRSTVRDWVATAARPSRVRPSPLREIPGEQVSWYDPDIGMTVPPSALRPNCRPASPKGTDLVMGDRR